MSFAWTTSKHLHLVAANGSHPKGAGIRSAEPPLLESAPEPQARMKKSLCRLTEEQMDVVSTLMWKKIEADRTLAELTSLMRHAALSGDRQAFHVAQVEAQAALKLCHANTLALQTAIAAFADATVRAGEEHRHLNSSTLTDSASQRFSAPSASVCR